MTDNRKAMKAQAEIDVAALTELVIFSTRQASEFASGQMKGYSCEYILKLIRGAYATRIKPGLEGVSSDTQAFIRKAFGSFLNELQAIDEAYHAAGIGVEDFAATEEGEAAQALMGDKSSKALRDHITLILKRAHFELDLNID